MFVAQNPGLDEIIKKVPLVGPAGKNFNKMLECADIDRNEIYISNVVKGRCVNGSKNRDPKPDEVLACRSFLEREIEIIRPELVVALGNFSLEFFTGHAGIMSCHGMIERSTRFDVDVIPVLHPSPFNFAKPERRKMIKDVFDEIKKVVDENGWRIAALRSG
jgi:DNA polymerase